MRTQSSIKDITHCSHTRCAVDALSPLTRLDVEPYEGLVFFVPLGTWHDEAQLAFVRSSFVILGSKRLFSAVAGKS